MITTRHSPDRQPNPELAELAPRSGETNTHWLARTQLEHGVLLLGGSSMVEFRIRFAQSRLRQDLLPSFWSMAGFLCGGETVATVADLRDLSQVPERNGVQLLSAAEFDDPELYPNIALIQFTEDDAAVRAAIAEISAQRSLIDLVERIVPWLGFVWGVSTHANPLLDGHGLPSASLVENAHGIAGIALTPGLASGASCPEAIWQSAKWWKTYYETSAAQAPRGRGSRAVVPCGRYAIRQPSAQVVERADGPARPAPRPAADGERARRKK